MNRRGVDFMVLLFFAVFLVLIALYVQLVSKVQGPQALIGEQQSTILAAVDARQKVDFFVQGAGEFSLRVAKLKVAQRGGFIGEPCGGVAQIAGSSCFVVNTADRPREVCRPEAAELLTKEFNAVFDGFASKWSGPGRLPLNNYELFAGADRTLMIARRPVVLDAVKSYSPVVLGKVSFRPSAVLAEKGVLQGYKEVFERLSVVAVACQGDAEVGKCVRDRLPAGWELKEGSNQFGVINPAVRACFGLNVVGKAKEGSAPAVQPVPNSQGEPLPSPGDLS